MIKEYPITFVVQEVNSDPFSEDSDRIYRGVAKCKPLGIEYAITGVFDTAEETIAAISAALRAANLDTLTDTLEEYSEKVCNQVKGILSTHEYTYKHKIA